MRAWEQDWQNMLWEREMNANCSTRSSGVVGKSGLVKKIDHKGHKDHKGLNCQSQN